MVEKAWLGYFFYEERRTMIISNNNKTRGGKVTKRHIYNQKISTAANNKYGECNR